MNITLQSDFVLPAEWQPQDGVMLTWPHEHTDWKPYLDDITKTYIELTRIIAGHETVIITTPDVQQVRRKLAQSLRPDEFSRVRFYQIDSNDTWARDHGPVTLVSKGSHKGHYIPVHLLDFNFNGWGEKFPYEKDNAINLQLYYAGAFNAALENHVDFTLEGGSIESDGNGTIMTTSQCLTAPHRNQPLTQSDIDARLKIIFHTDRVIWLNHGHLEGDDTDGHIDTLVRMAPLNTLLYVKAGDDPADKQNKELKLMEDELKSLKTASGTPYRLMPLPVPDPIYDGDDRLPATYANFLIINGAVICPTYRQPEKDKAAMAILQEAFPDRTITGIDATTVIRQHGSIHCLTMQFPKGTLNDNSRFNVL